jgi:hypothetical protein
MIGDPALAAAIKEKETVAAGFASLEREIDARKSTSMRHASGMRRSTRRPIP